MISASDTSNGKNALTNLTPIQREIYMGLSKIGEEISAFYLDGIRIYQADSLRIKSYLLAHITREIEGGIRDAFVGKKLLAMIEKEKGNEVTVIEQIAIVLDLEVDSIFVQDWRKDEKKFHKFAHRRSPLKIPRATTEFDQYWERFETRLHKVVGTHIGLLGRIDQLLNFDEPTDEHLLTLKNLLKDELLYDYFFREIKSIRWLIPLQNNELLETSKIPIPIEDPNYPENFIQKPWSVLLYIEKVAQENFKNPHDEITTVITNILDSIIDFERSLPVNSLYKSDFRIIGIIFNLPPSSITLKYISYIEFLLDRQPSLQLSYKLDETAIPALIRGKAKKALKELLRILLKFKKPQKPFRGSSLKEYESILGDDVSNMMFEKYSSDLCELLGIEAIEIVLDKMTEIISENESAFNPYIYVLDDKYELRHIASFQYKLAFFARDLLEKIGPSKITNLIKELLKNEHSIFIRLAIHTINHHYESLNHLFWEWAYNIPNPLELEDLKSELKSLFKDNCLDFDSEQIKKILGWIETGKYHIPDEEIDKTSEEQRGIAYRNREWLSAIAETKKSFVLDVIRKYESISSTELRDPDVGLMSRVTLVEDSSPITVERLLSKSNNEIVQYLNEFEDKDIHGRASTRGLSDTLQACVQENPAKFSKEIQLYLEVEFAFRNSILRGFLEVWKKDQQIDWGEIFKFIENIVNSGVLWQSNEEQGLYKYRSWLIYTVAELIEAGTSDDSHAFDPKFLPDARKILIELSEKTKSEYVPLNDIVNDVYNSLRGRLYSALITYSLRDARLKKDGEEILWDEKVQAHFEERIVDKPDYDPELWMTLGRFLSQLLYLDRPWVLTNFNHIFSNISKENWTAAMAGYLFFSRTVYQEVYQLMSEGGHIEKAIVTQFDTEFIIRGLVDQICIGYFEGWDNIKDDNSLIKRLITNLNISHLDSLVNYFWSRQETIKIQSTDKIKPLWRELYSQLKEKEENLEYHKTISDLVKWLSVIATIDEEVIKWVKFSGKYIQDYYDAHYLVEYLLFHVENTPNEVGQIYINLIESGIYPDYEEKNILGTIETLYQAGLKKVADKICDEYAKNEKYFLRGLYDKYNPIS